MSVWDTLGRAISHRFKRTPWNAAANTGVHNTLIRTEWIEALRSRGSCDHPLMGPCSRASKKARLQTGKVSQTYQLLTPSQGWNPFCGPNHPALKAVLDVQPLIELCIRIPTYIHTFGGWDRATARYSFEPYLPQIVLTRRSKGGFEDVATNVLVRQLPLVRELLLDGPLAREGILDKRSTENATSTEPTDSKTNNIEIFDALFVSAWLQNFDALQRSTPASHLNF
jgi:hypothetical protein